MHSVGIIGINGNLGKPTAQLLVKAAEQDKIKLIIFHREGKVGDFKAGKNVELRVIDLDGPTDKLEEVLRGINIFVSTVGVAGLMSEGIAMEAIAKSPDFVTYMPAMYSTTWSKEDFEDPLLGSFIGKMPGYTKPKELGIGITKVYTGVFDFTFFEQGFLYAPVKENSIYLNENLAKNPLPITTMDHLAHSIADIVTNNTPEAIKNKSFSAITFWATGAEIRDLYTNLHGKAANVNEWTKEVREGKRHDKTDFTGAIRVGYIDKWESVGWDYEREGRVLVKTEYQGQGLEEVVKKFL